MADIGGLAELQELEKQVRVLEKKDAAVKSAEKTAAGCSRIASSIQSSQGKDAFVATEGGTHNSFHTAAGATTSESACCIIS